MESERFLPIMLRESGSYFGKDNLFFHLRNCLLDRTAAKRTFLFCQRRRGQFMGELTLVMWRAGWQLRLVELPIGKVSGGLVGRSWVSWLLGLIRLGYLDESRSDFCGPAGF